MTGKKDGCNWYQKDPEEYTITLFGQVSPNRRPKFLRALYGKEAYECAVGYEYLKQMIEARTRHSPKDIINGTPYFPYVYLALKAFDNQRCEFIELGSSLFFSIERVLAHEKNCKLGLHIDRIDFIGIELSDFFSGLATLLHENQTISHYKDWREVPSPMTNRIAYSWCVPNYAFDNAEDYIQWLMQSRFTYCALYCSKKEAFLGTFTGKRCLFFDAGEIERQLRSKGYTMCNIDSRTLSCGDFQFYDLRFICHNLNDEELNIYDENKKKLNIPLFKNIDLKTKLKIPQDIDAGETRIISEKHFLNTPYQKNEQAEDSPEFDWTYAELYSSLGNHLAELGQKRKSEAILRKKEALFRNNSPDKRP
jgi:hypothetical protein